jgi:LPXTG-site transpeptidase (sortase) family protein
MRYNKYLKCKALLFITGCGASVARSFRVAEAQGSIPCTPTKEYNLFIMQRSETIRFLIIRSIGNFFVLVALYGVIMTFGPALKYELQYLLIQYRGIHFAVLYQPSAIGKRNSKQFVSVSNSKQPVTKSQSSPTFADILAGNKEQVLIPIDPLFSILIPKLGIDEQVVPNVDPNNPADYLPVLQHAVAHARGSVFPGGPGTIYLFAHSADNWWDIEHYNAVFYTLNNLSRGDEIVLFYENRRYNYFVTEQIISDPEDITLLTAKHQGPEQLVLQTCWPPGTSWKRLYVIATPKKV